MVKISSVFVCQQCGFQTTQFLGRCPECGSWNSLVEQIQEAAIQSSKSKVRKDIEIIDLSQLKKESYQRVSTKISEFDRVLGGGIVLGSAVLLSGDPGIGKSTLLTQLALNINSRLQNENNLERGEPADKLRKVLYIAGEESAQQIKLRADRISTDASIDILNETDIDLIANAISNLRPSLVIVDSIQTLESSGLMSAPGSVGQVRETAHRLQKLAKGHHIPMFIVGHVTKEGSIAGPKTLEHLVDVVLSLEGDSASNLRTLRALKNRFGPTDEVGVFEMEETGMKEVKNPSRLFLEQKVNAPGSIVIPILTGLRPLLVEIQALVTKTYLPVPRRTGFGVDLNRLQILVAVLAKRLQIPLYDQDIFVNITGGLKVIEPAADLGICMAIISSFRDQAINPKIVFVGEVGLLGEIRAVRGLDKRTVEAKNLGFDKVVSFKTVTSLSQAQLQVFKG